MKKESSKTSPIFFAPHLTVRNVLAELEFCKAAFCAIELRRWSNPDVGELSIAGALFHLHEEMPGSKELSPETLRGTTSTIGLFVPDPAATMKKAVAADARETNPVKDYDYGCQQGTVTDPAGHVWLIQRRI